MNTVIRIHDTYLFSNSVRQELIVSFNFFETFRD